MNNKRYGDLEKVRFYIKSFEEVQVYEGDSDFEAAWGNALARRYSLVLRSFLVYVTRHVGCNGNYFLDKVKLDKSFDLGIRKGVFESKDRKILERIFDIGIILWTQYPNISIEPIRFINGVLPELEYIKAIVGCESVRMNIDTSKPLEA